MGWNSTQRHGLRDEVYHVSIPNGIEFYLVACFSLRLSPIVSIPNGMELYELSKDVYDSFLSLFQFPTGWNSTKSGKTIKFVVEEFQFPTGWNSTDYLPFLPRMIRCFDSQLELKCETHISRIHRLSVEFYSTRS